MSGKKRPTSLEHRLEHYFRTNRYEQLSLADMMVKFDATELSVVSALKRLRSDGVPLVCQKVWGMDQEAPAP